MFETELIAMPFSQASSALARFTVLDLTQVRAGPTAVRELADWGANVIKIEPPRRRWASTAKRCCASSASRRRRSKSCNGRRPFERASAKEG